MGKSSFYTILILFFAKISISQSIQGFIYDEGNNPVPYARIYVKNFTNLGAIADQEGKYYFGCEMGTYEVIYKCLGFEEQDINVTVDKLQPTVKNVYLKQKSSELNLVEVKAKRKNVGWQIVQNVISHKKELIRQYEAYSCDVYIKGVESFDVKKRPNQKSEDPENEPTDKFRKQKDEINNQINGESRLNMVEINLEKHFEYPNRIKEIRNGYDKIGKPRQVYFQTTTGGEFNFYKSLIRKDDLHKTPIVSPLHPSGILSYKYKLRDVIIDGRDTTYKIEISPRSVGTSTLKGFLWVLKSEWVLTKVDLSMHKGNLKKYDNFRITQEYEKIDSFWIVSRQAFVYDTKYGKETVKGITTVAYSGWKFNQIYPPKFFGNEIGITTEEAYERDSTYWDDIRPVPLTPEEQHKKFVQDSLTSIYTSEKYLDSVDGVFNKITFLKVLYFGIEHRDRKKKTQWYLSSLVDLYEPLGMGGMRIGPGFDLFKKWEDEQWIDFNGDLTIGFNNADLRGDVRVYHRYLPKKFGTWSVWFSRDAEFINRFDAFLNQWNRSNWYVNNQGGLWHNMELFNGFFLSTGVRLENRTPFDSSYKFNTYFDQTLEQDKPTFFEPYYAFRTNIGVSFTPGQKFMTEPNQKIILGSVWPTISLYWEKGWRGPFGSTVDFDYLSLTVEQEFQIGTMGKSKYRVKTGTFINQDSVFYIDKKFFRQSDVGYFGWLFSPPLHSFQNLDSSYETQDFYAELHYIHHFNGSIMNKIPFMKKTGIQAVGGGGFLYLPEHKHHFYTELYVGLERTFKFLKRRIRLGTYITFSWDNDQFALPDDKKPKNIRFKLGLDVMNERDLKFNF